MTNIANEDAEVGVEEDSGEEIEEEAEELNAGGAQMKRMMVSEELSEAPVGEGKEVTREGRDTFRVPIEVICKVTCRDYGFSLPEVRLAVRGSAGFHSFCYAGVLLGNLGG